MKIVLLLLISHASLAQIVLPEKTARFYLERHYTAKLQHDQLQIKDKMIANLKLQLDQKDELVYSYVAESESRKEMVLLREKEIKLLEKDLKTAYREVTKQKIQKKLAIVGCILLTVLIAK